MSEGFPERVKQLRRLKGLHQSDLGKQIGVHKNQIGRYERGTSKPSGEALKLLAEALGVSTDYLISGSVEDIAQANIEDRDLLRLFREIEDFDAKDKEVVKTLLDAFVKKKRFVALATE